MADWCSLCLYMKIGSYTPGSSCVQVYIQSHVRKDQKGFVSKWAQKLTRGKPLWTGTWQRGKWKYDFVSQTKKVARLDRKISLFLCNTTEEKQDKKNRREKHKCWVSWGGKKTKTQQKTSAKFQQKGSPLGRLACKTFPHILEEEKKRKREKTEKDSHQKTQASCTSQQTISNWSLQRTVQSRSFSCLPLLFWMGPYWFLKSQSTEPDTCNVSGRWWMIICASVCSSSVFAWRNSSTCGQRQTLNWYIDERGFRWSKRKNNKQTA